MRIRLDQTGSLPRVMNRSLNCHNPQDEATLLPFLPTQWFPAGALLVVQGARPHRSWQAPPNLGRKGLSSSAPTRLPGQHSGLGETPGRPETPTLVVGGLRKKRASAHSAAAPGTWVSGWIVSQGSGQHRSRKSTSSPHPRAGLVQEDFGLLLKLRARQSPGWWRWGGFHDFSG